MNNYGRKSGYFVVFINIINMSMMIFGIYENMLLIKQL